MTMTGADVEGLRTLATDFTRGATELHQLSAELARAIDAADDWQGPDATRAKGQWGELARSRLSGVAGALEAAGTLLEREATEQEVGSAATSTTAAHPSLLSRLHDYGLAAFKAWGVGKKLAALASFFRSLDKSSFFARMRPAVAALRTLGGTANKAPRWLLKAIDRLGLDKLSTSARFLGKWAGRLSPLLTVWSGVQDARTGGGYGGWRGDVTRVLGGFGAGGAAVLGIGAFAGLAAAAPLAIGAGFAVTAYGAWSLGNLAYDKIPMVKQAVDAGGAAVRATWTRTWQGARSILDISKTFARGLLGPAPSPVGA